MRAGVGKFEALIANGGGMNRLTDTDGKTEVWKFPPVFYGTLALWGPCPKSGSVHPKLTNTAKLRLFKKQIRDAKTDS